MLSDDPRVVDLVSIAVKVVAEPLREEIAELRRQLAERHPARIVAEACKPWEHSVGEPPPWESPLHEVYSAGATKAAQLLADLLGVKQYTDADGSESFDGDLLGTLRNIIIEHRAERIYNSWAAQEGFVPWVPGGNSAKQHEARDLADEELSTPAAPLKQQ